jgi:hypothetical protein
MSSRVIWQYWESVDEKPAFVDGLNEIAKVQGGNPPWQSIVPGKFSSG